jgi:hypothetical protein
MIEQLHRSGRPRRGVALCPSRPAMPGEGDVRLASSTAASPAPPLPFPDEPLELRARIRLLLERSPGEGQQLLQAGDWIAGPLWRSWQDQLEPCGVDAERFRHLVIAYRNELRLWVMGERPWRHCVEGLIGRISRRLWR